MADASGYRDRGLGDNRRHSNHKRTRGEIRGGDKDELDDAKRVKRRYGDYERGNGEGREHRYDESRHSSRRSDSVSRQNNLSLREGREEYHSKNSFPSRRSPSTSSARHHRSSDHHHHHHHHHHKHRRSSTPSTRTPNELPLGARALVRSDFETFKPLFAQYLEVQKRKDITALDEREVKGRWKSFIGKWNRGELAEGWYSPEMLLEATKAGFGGSTGTRSATEDRNVTVKSPSERPSGYSRERSREDEGSIYFAGEEEDEDEDDDDEYGPTLPGSAPAHSHLRDQFDATRSTKRGPGIPSRQDLDLRRENAEEERMQRISDLRLERKADRAEQRARLEELVPRAEAGTRERRLEKKREVNEKMRGFREKSPGAIGEVGEAELMGGGGDDSIAEYKRLKAAAERRKTEREIRREEEARIRAAEREDRVREYRRREEDTIEVLRRIARERFGSG